MPSVIWDIIEPVLRYAGVYQPADPTYGRYLIPCGGPEQALDDNPSIKTSRRRIFLRPDAPYDSVEVEFVEDVELTAKELLKERLRGGRWVYYRVFEMEESGLKEKGGCGVDVCIVHGLNEYGTRYSPHIPKLLEAGFRVIVPDLPSFGRSTGLHCCLPSNTLLTSALYAVLQDVTKVDVALGRKQKQVFLSGASMGGWTVLYYLISYPPTQDIAKITSANAGHDQTEPEGSESKHHKEYRPKIAGAFAMCPLVEVAPESRPPIVIEKLAPLINVIAPTLPVAKAVRGKVSDDPRVEAEFLADPLTYHGKLRVCTGLSLLKGLTDLSERAEEIDFPIRIIHGDRDRATSHLATKAFFDRIPHPDKELKIYEGYEHVMMKVGIDAADDAKRQAVLTDWCGWLLSRAEIDRASGSSD